MQGKRLLQLTGWNGTERQDSLISRSNTSVAHDWTRLASKSRVRRAAPSTAVVVALFGPRVSRSLLPTWTAHTTMPIAPITGMLRKRLWLDLSVGLGLGVTAAYGFWYGIHLKSLQRQEEYYLRLERSRVQEAA